MTNENGRSMVEMLGVLAIIGVLSVAGIAGYTMAMNKYRANEVLNTASQLVVLAKASAAIGGTGPMTLDDANLDPPYAGVGITVADRTAAVPALTIAGAGTDPCNNIQNSVNASVFTVSACS